MEVSVRSIAKRLRLKKLFLKAFGVEAYSSFRAFGALLDKDVDLLKATIAQRIVNTGVNSTNVPTIVSAGVAWAIIQDMTFPQAVQANFHLVSAVLIDADIKWWLVAHEEGLPNVIGVDSRSRGRVLFALERLGSASGIFVHGVEGPVVLRHVSTLSQGEGLRSDNVIGVLKPRVVDGSNLRYGVETSCQIEFWNLDNEGLILAPRENRASRQLAQSEFVLVDAKSSTKGLIPGALTRVMLDDVTFPIDAVYTWVDGDDSAWIERRRLVESAGRAIEYHPEAGHSARFRSRDELKFSLRSVDMYAPWFRNVYIVTAGQTPKWLNVNHPRVKVVDHKEIYPNVGYLPTFNSNSIISRLHHIEGLSQHYVYINDDVFFGRPVKKEEFFLSNGIAKVSPSKNRRPFGAPAARDEPHLNLTRNMRSLLEREFGVTISRAIKHTPHPQLRSVHFEMEERFREIYEQTWASRFRHHDDIVADQLHHYYAQIIGKAVPTNLQYTYINILDDNYRYAMQEILRLRHRDTFCINDAPVQGAKPMPDEEVVHFLEQYFPVKSQFEK